MVTGIVDGFFVRMQQTVGKDVLLEFDDNQESDNVTVVHIFKIEWIKNFLVSEHNQKAKSLGAVIEIFGA